MKRIVITLVFAGLVGLIGAPRSAEAGIFGRWFRCGGSSSGTTEPVVVASEGGAVDVGRRYSYEPTDSSPVVRSETSRAARVPNYSFQKTDPRRYLNY